jgi:protochlorophyllide reductase
MLAHHAPLVRPHRQLGNNAAVYLPRLEAPMRGPEGCEISVATNHLGHVLLARLLMPDLHKASNPAPRRVTLGTVTANSKEFGGTVTANSKEFGGKVPIPAPADLGDLRGLEAGFRAPVAMTDGKAFESGKACTI